MLFLINIYLFMTYLLLYVICIWRNMQILINIKSNFCLQIIAEIFQYYKVFLFNIIQRNLFYEGQEMQEGFFGESIFVFFFWRIYFCIFFLRIYLCMFIRDVKSTGTWYCKVSIMMKI